MDATENKLFFCKLRDISSRRCGLLTSASVTLHSNNGLLLFLIIVLLMTGCKTVPIEGRYVAGKGGFWEQDENTGSRFHHNAIADSGVIGFMHASGKSALLNGAQVKESSKIKNNSFVSTGSQSGARIEFKESDSACLVRVDELNLGNAYADTSECQQSIKTIHAIIEAKGAILHINVSQHQTVVMVISGMVEVVLREDATQSIDIREDQEVIITHDSIGRPRRIAPDEIWQRVRWRDDFQLYKTVVDWNKVIAVAVTVAIVAAAILLTRGHGGGGRGSGFPRHR